MEEKADEEEKGQVVFSGVQLCNHTKEKSPEFFLHSGSTIILFKDKKELKNIPVAVRDL